MEFFSQKKLIASVAYILLAAIGIGLITPVAIIHAQINPVGAISASKAAGAAASAAGTSAGGGIKQSVSNSLTGIAQGTLKVDGAILAISGGLAILQVILSYVLTLVSFILDNVFYWNTIFTPGSIEVIRTAWTVMRDLANSVFILVILWIAFTIIFDLETLGGKKLLVRVIIVALLINFSMVFVSAVFAFTNALAKPFQEAIKTTDVAGLIIGKTQLHTITTMFDEKTAQEIKQAVEQQPQVTTPNSELSVFENQQSIFQKLGLSNPAQPTEALAQSKAGTAAGTAATGAGIGTSIGCGLGALVGLGVGSAVTTPVGCVAGTLLGSIVAVIGSMVITAGTIAVAWKMIPTLAVGNLFLFLTVFAFATVSFVLLARIVVMAFLTALAPAALMLRAIPSKTAEGWWDKWVNTLIKYAFFAPAFYFLFWFSLLVLKKMSAVLPVNNFFSANAQNILTHVVFLTFLFGSIKLAREMGITVADKFVNWGKALGWSALGFAGGMATGALRQGGLTALRGVTRGEEGWTQRLLRGAARYPLAAGATKPLAEAFLKQLVAQKKEVQEAASKLAPLNKQEKQASFRRALTARDMVAAAQALGPDIKEMLSDQELQRALKLSSQFGLQENILKVRPDLATAALVPEAKGDNAKALRDTILKIKPNELPNVAKSALTPEVLELMWKNYGPEYLRQLGQSEKKDLRDTFMNGLTPELQKQITPETYRFLDNNAARGFGFTLPHANKRPVKIIQEQAFEKTNQRLELEKKQKQFEEKAASLLRAGQQREAKRAEIDAGQMTDKIKALQREIDALNAEAKIRS